MRVSVVGVCASGKSTLVGRLRQAGLDAREAAQEHSYVPDLWLRWHSPDVLVYLEASLETILRRRPGSLMSAALYEDMMGRLARAREAATLIVTTDRLTEEEVAGKVLAYLTRHYPAGIITPACQ